VEKGNLYFQNFRIMSTSNLSKETEKNLIDFFNKSVDPKVMAKAIRQLNYIVALGVMRET
jgi:ferredoxin-fold anticodon binding domain-containing protein